MHGLLDETNPPASFLAFADRPLTAQELYQRDIPLRVQLVVMSACQTSLGHPHPDSGIGLSNAFLIAGARSVASTLWRIPDHATLALMQGFYEAMRAGDTLDVALAKAQRAVLQLPEWQHPFYWAAFKLTGSMTNPFAAALAR